jgi:hypothetical protein
MPEQVTRVGVVRIGSTEFLRVGRFFAAVGQLESIRIDGAEKATFHFYGGRAAVLQNASVNSLAEYLDELEIDILDEDWS